MQLFSPTGVYFPPLFIFELYKIYFQRILDNVLPDGKNAPEVTIVTSSLTSMTCALEMTPALSAKKSMVILLKLIQ